MYGACSELCIFILIRVGAHTCLCVCACTCVCVDAHVRACVCLLSPMVFSSQKLYVNETQFIFFWGGGDSMGLAPIPQLVSLWLRQPNRESSAPPRD